MQTKVQKWGNSLALRIPKAFADEISIEQNASVEISVVEGKIVIAPIAKEALTLDDLLVEVTTDNLHSEIDFGEAVGNEVW